MPTNIHEIFASSVQAAPKPLNISGTSIKAIPAMQQ